MQLAEAKGVLYTHVHYKPVFTNLDIRGFFLHGDYNDIVFKNLHFETHFQKYVF